LFDIHGTSQLGTFAMTKKSKELLGVLLFVVILVSGALWLWRLGAELTAEYTTAGVIRDVTKFVETHEGRWPKNWKELGCADHVPSYVHFNFDVTPDELIKDGSLIHKTITPVTGAYHTYPHATRELNELRDVLMRLNQPESNSIPQSCD